MLLSVCLFIVLLYYLLFCNSCFAEIQDVLGKMIVQFSIQSINANELKTFLGLYKIVGIKKVCIQSIKTMTQMLLL